jgi:hypothetical protein
VSADRDVARWCEQRVGRAHALSTICVGDARHKVLANEVATVAALARAAIEVSRQPDAERPWPG